MLSLFVLTSASAFELVLTLSLLFLRFDVPVLRFKKCN
jgi:hypothetical protein